MPNPAVLHDHVLQPRSMTSWGQLPASLSKSASSILTACSEEREKHAKSARGGPDSQGLGRPDVTFTAEVAVQPVPSRTESELEAKRMGSKQRAHTLNSEMSCVTTKTTWVSEAPLQSRRQWGDLRKRLAKIVETRNFDIVMGAIIILNIALMVVEADIGAACEDKTSLCTPYWLSVFNIVLLAIYTVELIIRFFIYRRYFFDNRWNTIDVIIVTVGYVEVLLSGSSGLQVVRICRLGRLARLLRLLRVFPTLYTMTKGFASTMTTILWGFALILALLLVWSLITVELVHPRNSELFEVRGGDRSDWCFRAYSSVGNSIVYFFQTLVAGDSWGTCSIPLMREYPETFVIFSFAYITVQLGFTNLILAVIVDAAAKAREGDLRQKLKEKKQMEKEATDKLSGIIRNMDKDGNGQISWSELQSSFRFDREVRDLMALLDMDEKDLYKMFHLMDMERSGSLDYRELVETISKAEEQDVRVQLMILKLNMAEVSFKLDQFFSHPLSMMPHTASSLCGSVCERSTGRTRVGSNSTTVSFTPSTVSNVRSDEPESPSARSLSPKHARFVVEEENPKEENPKEAWTPDKNPTQVAECLEQELGILRMGLVRKLEELSQEAAEQVSTLTQQTKTLSSLVSSNSPASGFRNGKSRWSKNIVTPVPTAPLYVVPDKRPAEEGSGRKRKDKEEKDRDRANSGNHRALPYTDRPIGHRMEYGAIGGNIQSMAAFPIQDSFHRV